MSPTDELPPLREVIRRHQLSARKSLGQNFLLDLNLTNRIARAAGPLSGVTVIEVGPGPGGLTRALLACGARRVAAVERDRRAVAALAEAADHYAGRLIVIQGDAMRFDPQPFLGDGPVRVVANLPYNIATTLLLSWLSVDPWPPWYDALVLTFQREVAERLVAPVGTKAYGRLSVLAQWRTEPKVLFDIAPSACRSQSCGAGRGLRRTTEEVTLGGGTKALGAMSKRTFGSVRHWARTDRRP